VTHEYPPNRAFDSVSISRVAALRDFGSTQRQREFLVTVMIMETLGHSQISLTLNTYSHVLPALQAEAAAKLDAILTR
jgi:hypothetical protein